MPVHILAIESSCDETAAAVCADGKILSNVIASQKIHEQYGGVIPELASRAHMQHIVPVVDTALRQAGISMGQVDAIAFTQAPGLIGALLVGAQFAKSLSLALDVPLIAVHHMQAHVLANLIDDPKPDFPFLCLTVSGGHTQIVLCKSPSQLQVLGQTIDDAAGEAFDKSAKLLGLPYPGGPLIDKYAKEGNPQAYKFPEPKMDTARIFQSGRSQAVRLPKEFRFAGTEVGVRHFGNGVLLLPADDPWATLEAGLSSFEPGFTIAREQPEAQTRNDIAA